MYCTHCGKELTNNSKFCMVCGKPTGATAAPASPLPQESPAVMRKTFACCWCFLCFLSMASFFARYGNATNYYFGFTTSSSSFIFSGFKLMSEGKHTFADAGSMLRLLVWVNAAAIVTGILYYFAKKRINLLRTLFCIESIATLATSLATMLYLVEALNKAHYSSVGPGAYANLALSIVLVLIAFLHKWSAVAQS